MIHKSAELKVVEKTRILDATCLSSQLRKSMRDPNAFQMTCVPPISRLEPMEYVTQNLVTQQSTIYQSKQL